MVASAPATAPRGDHPATLSFTPMNEPFAFRSSDASRASATVVLSIFREAILEPGRPAKLHAAHRFSSGRAGPVEAGSWRTGAADRAVAASWREVAVVS